MPAAAAGGDGPVKLLWQIHTMPTISKISAAMHATTIPIINPVDKDLEGLASGAGDGADDGAGDGNVAKTAINSSTLMDPSPVMGSHPVVG